MKLKELFHLVLRYVLLIVIAFPDLSLIYNTFTLLTIYPVIWLLSLFYSEISLLSGNIIFLSGSYIELIPACIGGAAYFLLLTLNLTTPMDITKRITSLIFIVLSFLVLNIIRIIIFTFLYVKGFAYFSIAHQFTWYFGSTILVVLIWFTNIFIFKIRAIPIYTDVRAIFSDIVSEETDKEKNKKTLKRKVNKILNKIENKEKRKKKKIKEEFDKIKKNKNKK